VVRARIELATRGFSVRTPPPENPEENGIFGDSAAPGAAVKHENGPMTPWLGACPVDLDDEQREAILVIVNRVET